MRTKHISVRTFLREVRNIIDERSFDGHHFLIQFIGDHTESTMIIGNFMRWCTAYILIFANKEIPVSHACSSDVLRLRCSSRVSLFDILSGKGFRKGTVLSEPVFGRFDILGHIKFFRRRYLCGKNAPNAESLTQLEEKIALNAERFFQTNPTGS